MNVKELRELLSNFPEDMRVVDSGYDDIEAVREKTWVHGNYPYNLPEEQVVMIL